MTMTRKETIANRHRLAAEHMRAEGNLVMVGFHTIQADLWEASHRRDVVREYRENQEKSNG